MPGFFMAKKLYFKGFKNKTNTFNHEAPSTRV